jgi:hypothetical protein
LINNFEYGQQCLPRQISLVKEFLWLALALLSLSFANDFAIALLDSKETTSTFFAHLEMHKSGGRKACFIQGLFGAGKTFSTAMYAFLIAIFTKQKLLWVSHNNKPLEEAAKTLRA